VPGATLDVSAIEEVLVASRTRGGVLVVAVVALAGAFFAPKLFDKLGSMVSDVTGANDAVTIGQGDTAIMVAVDAQPKLVTCDPAKIISEKRCGDLKILVVRAVKMPFIARNTKLAWESGRPAVLTMNRAKQDANRRAACSSVFVARYDGQCDEYPMASTNEGGKGARTTRCPSVRTSARVALM
jgi:hypothetical protein